MREWLRCETYAKCKYPRVYPMRSCHVPRPRLSWTSRVSRVPRRARPLYSLQPDYGSPQRLDTFYDSILRCHLFTYLELIHLYRNFCICLINETAEIRSSLPIFIRANVRMIERFTIRYYGDFMIHLYRNCLIMQLRKFGWIFTELKCFHFIYIETFASTLCNNGTVEIRFDLETIGFTILRCFRRLNWLYDLFISKLSYLPIIMKLRKFGWIVARLQTSQRTEFKCFRFTCIDTA